MHYKHIPAFFVFSFVFVVFFQGCQEGSSFNGTGGQQIESQPSESQNKQFESSKRKTPDSPQSVDADKNKNNISSTVVTATSISISTSTSTSIVNPNVTDADAREINPSGIPTVIASVPKSSSQNSSTVVPDGVESGQEIFTDCDRCLQRAKELGQSIGLTVDKAKAVNEGFYKIDPAKNLCDIHFVPYIGVKIRDHQGQQSSILGNQIALYCPCSCGWGT